MADHAGGHHDPTADVFHHVRDANLFEFPFGLQVPLPKIPIPEAFAHALGLHENYFQITKFMVLQVVAAGLALLIFGTLARKIGSGQPVQGRFWNFWETLVVFIRDEVVRPTIGHGHHHDEHEAPQDHHRSHDEVHGDGNYDIEDSHGVGVPGHLSRSGNYAIASNVGAEIPDSMAGIAYEIDTHGTVAVGPHRADKYLPFVLSCFFYVLFCNLMGAIPWLGTPTGSLTVTAVLAATVFGYVVVAGSRESGPAGFWMSLVPSMDLPGPLKILLLPMIWAIEFVGLIIKHGVLAIRLFANMVAGHTVLFVILSFIYVAAHASTSAYFTVLPISLFGQVGISMLELFVAFLQAYVFTFLTTLFISAAVNPH